VITPFATLAAFALGRPKTAFINVDLGAKTAAPRKSGAESSAAPPHRPLFERLNSLAREASRKPFNPAINNRHFL
jgi:hypothetical protein